MAVVGKQFVAQYKIMIDRNFKLNDEERQGGAANTKQKLAIGDVQWHVWRKCKAAAKKEMERCQLTVTVSGTRARSPCFLTPTRQ